MLTDREIEDYLSAIEKHFIPKLTEWEHGFFFSIKEQWERKHTLSDKQSSKLNSIMERLASGHGRNSY